MVLVIDTSSARSAVAVLDRAGVVLGEVIEDSGPGFDLPRRVRELMAPAEVTRVAVALGPGSFTGLRIGASYALGLAMGLGVPLVRLSTLELAAARAPEAATGLSEAGRGRVYALQPGGATAHLEAGALSNRWPATGWLRGTTAEAVRAAGVRLLEEVELAGFGATAARLIGAAPELGYDRVRLDYMQSFGPLR